MELTTRENGISVKGLNANYAQDVRLFNDYQARTGEAFPEALTSYFQEIKDHYRPATIARKKQALKAAIKKQIGQGLTLSQAAQLNTFFDEIKTPKAQKQITADQTLDAEDLKRLVNAAGRKSGLIIRALYSTAARVSELVNIKLADCTVKKDGVSVRIIGKGRKERTVYLDPELFQEIKKTYRGKVYLFEAPDGGPLSRITVYFLIQRAGKKIGRPDIHPHTVRHSFATNRLSELGIDTVGAYLGHANISTTATYYLHNVPTLKTILQGAAL